MEDANDQETATPQPIEDVAEDAGTQELQANSTTTTNDTEVKVDPKGTAQPSPVAATVQSVTDKALHFLAHASNETLGACLVGVGAATYLLLGRVGLVIIGVAGGVVLHATWEGSRYDDRDEATKRADAEKRRQTGAEVAKRILDWRSSRSGESAGEDARVLAAQPLDYSSFEPETRTALNSFTDAVIKDYVYYWYRPQIPNEESFPASCRRTFTAFILSLSGHLHRKRPADAFLDFVTNASSIVIVFLNELAVALNASPNATPAEAISAYLELKPDSSLSYVLDEKSQRNKLELISEDILQAYLDPKAYNCEPVHLFLKQVLAQLVLGYTVTLCSRPEWINEWIVYGLEESETTREVMDIVDAGVEGRKLEKKPELVPDQAAPQSAVVSKKEGDGAPVRPVDQHKRQMSKAEEAMDEAMREAKRLTQMMIEEDERRAREEQQKHERVSSSGYTSDATTQGAPTPTSSQSDRDLLEGESSPRTSNSQAPSMAESASIEPEHKQFTSFDQLVPALQPAALSNNENDTVPVARPPPAPLTLHNATVSIFDDSVPGEKAKPMTDYWIQIEPASSLYSGWMIARKYADFETLHEVLRRISVITGVFGFTETHGELPKWRGNTKALLRTELEKYLTDAVRFSPLAESEGMKRFLEKDQGLNKSPSARGTFGWPTPDAFGKIGGDMMNVLTKAPKQVAGGGKAVFGGVAGGGKAVFGGVAGLVGGVNKRQSQLDLTRTNTASSVDASQPRPSLASDEYGPNTTGARTSQDSLRAAPSDRPRLDRHISAASTVSFDNKPLPGSPQRPSLEVMREEDAAAASFTPTTPSSKSHASFSSPRKDTLDMLDTPIHLPPPPSEMPEDYGSPSRVPANRNSVETFGSTRSLEGRQPDATEATEPAAPPMPPRPAPSKAASKPKEPLSESETSVAVELMFAVITELYTLSSAWNIRRTLLQAAKTFLLRPGNPQLGTIKDLIQTSLLDANLSDAGIAAQIYKIRENALPTEEELKIWYRDYPEKNDEQKEELRVKARKLLVSKGMPAALQSVMGAAASGEALGKVFDCLQVPAVSRGLIFGLMLQALRVVTH